MKKNQEQYCSEKEQGSLYRIGMFAQMNHVTVKTLRFYEEKGLLLPAKVDEMSGYRYYTMSQMETLHRILALKELGFSIEDIRRLNRSASEKDFLSKMKSDILEQISQLTLKLSKLETYLSNPENSLDNPVMIKTVPACICANVEQVLDDYSQLFDYMPEMGALMEEAGCRCTDPEYCFTHYPEPGYMEENIHVETCQAVREKKEVAGVLRFKEFPQIEAACIYHKGPYTEFARSYDAVLKYIEENDYEICGGIRESYIDGIWNRDSEDEWLSEIQIPVKKKEGDR